MDMRKLNMKKHTFPGRLISFCGLDGCGKTTMINMLSQYLMRKSYKVVLTKQPTSFMRRSEIFRTYMDCPKHDNYEYRSLSLMAASDRLQHSAKFIEPLLKEGHIVITDRYFYSCLANLRARGYVQDKWIYEIAEQIIEPDLSVFLNIDVETAVKRVRSREEEKDRYIDMELQNHLHQEYIDIAELNHYPILYSGEEKEKTFNELKRLVEEMLKESVDILNEEKIIKEIIKKHSHILVDEIDEDENLRDLGFDSFSNTQLILSLEKELGFEFSLEKLHPKNFSSIRAIKETVQDVIQEVKKQPSKI